MSRSPVFILVNYTIYGEVRLAIVAAALYMFALADPKLWVLCSVAIWYPWTKV